MYCHGAMTSGSVIPRYFFPYSLADNPANNNDSVPPEVVDPHPSLGALKISKPYELLRPPSYTGKHRDAIDWPPSISCKLQLVMTIDSHLHDKLLH